MDQNAPTKFGMGAPVRRIEDLSLITGHGCFTADIMPPGALSAHVVRSAAAHARFRVERVEAARALPGVHLVWTAEDVADIAPMPCIMKGPKPEKVQEPPYPVLAREVVRHVGEAVAFVVADDPETAIAAGEALTIDYEMLPPVVDTEAAAEEGAPLVWPERGTNVAFTHEAGDAAATEAEFARAERVAEIRIVNNRVVANYMEPRGIIAEYDPESGHYKATLGTQGVFGMRARLAGVLGIDPETIRVVTPDVGGGFGTKAFLYGEYPLALKAAKATGRPVKWICDRSEHFLADAHGRDQVTKASFAMDSDGKVRAMRIDAIANMGAYLHQFGPHIPWSALTMATGVYDIPVLHAQCRCVFSNTLPTDAYRGAGRPEGSYLVERLMDEAAQVAGLDPIEIRRRNFIRPEQMPYKTQGGRLYDSGDFAGHLDRALEAADHAGFEARAAESRGRGMLRGIGISTYIEACAFPGSETAKAVLEEDGTISVHVGTQTNGQGHHTAYAQFVGEPLGIDMDRIRVRQGDSAELPSGSGTGGSRSVPLGLPAVIRASEALAERIRELAAAELETSAGDIELADGEARVAGTDRAISYAAIAATVTDKATLSAVETYSADLPTFPNGTHVCEIEIDPETGSSDIVRYTVVDDFGVVVNPLLLAGQIHGGVAQGIGQALLEHTVYDAEGQLISATFNDYAMPRAWDIPPIDFETRNVPTEANLLGIKGAGEAGTVGSAQAVMNAIADALQRAGRPRAIDMPATPERVWAALQIEAA